MPTEAPRCELCNVGDRKGRQAAAVAIAVDPSREIYDAVVRARAEKHRPLNSAWSLHRSWGADLALEDGPAPRVPDTIEDRHTPEVGRTLEDSLAITGDPDTDPVAKLLARERLAAILDQDQRLTALERGALRAATQARRVSAPGWGPGGRRFKSCLPEVMRRGLRDSRSLRRCGLPSRETQQPACRPLELIRSRDAIVSGPSAMTLAFLRCECLGRRRSCKSFHAQATRFVIPRLMRPAKRRFARGVSIGHAAPFRSTSRDGLAQDPPMAMAKTCR